MAFIFAKKLCANAHGKMSTFKKYSQNLGCKRMCDGMHMAKCQLPKNFGQMLDANEGVKEFWVVSFKKDKVQYVRNL